MSSSSRENELRRESANDSYVSPFLAVFALSKRFFGLETRTTQENPKKNFIGVDIKGARMWRGCKTSNENGMKKMATIDRMSKYGITLRNQLSYIFVLIQHQAQAQEGGAEGSERTA